MGELWNLPLRATSKHCGAREVVLALDGHTPITPARWTRTLRLHGDDPVLRLHTRIENVGHKPFAFSWGSHPAIAVREGTRLDVPARGGEVTDAGTGGPLGNLGEAYAYPCCAKDPRPSSTSAACRALPSRSMSCTH